MCLALVLPFPPTGALSLLAHALSDSAAGGARLLGTFFAREMLVELQKKLQSRLLRPSRRADGVSFFFYHTLLHMLLIPKLLPRERVQMRRVGFHSTSTAFVL